MDVIITSNACDVCSGEILSYAAEGGVGSDVSSKCKSCDSRCCRDCLAKHLSSDTRLLLEPTCWNCEKVFCKEVLLKLLGADLFNASFEEPRRRLLVERNEIDGVGVASNKYCGERKMFRCKNPKCAGGAVVTVTDRRGAINASVSLAALMYDVELLFTPRSRTRCVECAARHCDRCERRLSFLAAYVSRFLFHRCDRSAKKNNEFLRERTKPCPTCGVATELASGCSQMFCAYCQTSFDWNDLRIIDPNDIFYHNEDHDAYVYWYRTNVSLLPRLIDVQIVGNDERVVRLFDAMFDLETTVLRDCVRVIDRAPHQNRAARIKYKLNEISLNDYKRQLSEIRYRRDAMVNRARRVRRLLRDVSALLNAAGRYEDSPTRYEIIADIETQPLTAHAANPTSAMTSAMTSPADPISIEELLVRCDRLFADFNSDNDRDVSESTCVYVVYDESDRIGLFASNVGKYVFDPRLTVIRA